MPRVPGVLSAIGLLTAPLAVDLARTRMRDLTGAQAPEGEEIDAGWRELEEEANRALAAQGSQVERSRRTADCRYRGQGFELEIPAPTSDPASIADAFHAAHRERYGYEQRERVVELITLRVRAEGPPSPFAMPAVPEGRGADGARAGERDVLVEGRTVTCPVYRRERLGAGDVLSGPAVVAGPDSTCLVLDGQRGSVDGFGTLVLTEA